MPIDHLTGCDCPEARLLRVILAGPLDVAVDALAATRAAEMLRGMSHDLAAATDWSTAILPASRRPLLRQSRQADRYSTPARSAEQIRDETAASWDRFEKDRGYR